MLFDTSSATCLNFTSPKTLNLFEDDYLNFSKPIFTTHNVFSLSTDCKSSSSKSKPTSTSALSTVNDSKNQKKTKLGKEKKVKGEKIDMAKKLAKKLRLKNSSFNNGRWTQGEHKRFIDSILKYGNDWRKVEQHIGTRSSTQARSHAQKFFEKMKLANMVDEVIDLNNKTSIKSLQETLKLMEKENYLYTVEDINGIPFERKKSGKTSQKNKNQANNQDIPENFGDLDSKSTEGESQKSKLSPDDDEKMPSESILCLRKEEDDHQNLSLSLPTKGKELTSNSINYNKFLKKKRLRNFSYNSIDLNKHLLDIEYSEIDEIDFQYELVELFEKERIPSSEDFSSEEDEVLYVVNCDFGKNYNISSDIKNGEELVKGFFV